MKTSSKIRQISFWVHEYCGCKHPLIPADTEYPKYWHRINVWSYPRENTESMFDFLQKFWKVEKSVIHLFVKFREFQKNPEIIEKWCYIKMKPNVVILRRINRIPANLFNIWVRSRRWLPFCPNYCKKGHFSWYTCVTLFSTLRQYFSFCFFFNISESSWSLSFKLLVSIVVRCVLQLSTISNWSRKIVDFLYFSCN